MLKKSRFLETRFWEFLRLTCRKKCVIYKKNCTFAVKLERLWSGLKKVINKMQKLLTMMQRKGVFFSLEVMEKMLCKTRV